MSVSVRDSSGPGHKASKNSIPQNTAIIRQHTENTEEKKQKKRTVGVLKMDV
jgi:hypothetical protein